jgi:hypothetical protein
MAAAASSPERNGGIGALGGISMAKISISVARLAKAAKIGNRREEA